MPSQTKPATGGNNIDDGLADWNNPNSITSSDDAWAYAQLNPTSNFSDTLHAQFGNFSIPAGVTILGIQLTVERSRTGLGSPVTVTDRRIHLAVNSAGGIIPHGDNKADLTTAWPGSDTNKVYGSSSDLWGETWLPSHINDAQFGALIQCRTLSSSGDTADCNVDYVEITVTYAEVVQVTPWTDYGQVIKRQRRRVVAPFGDTPAGA